MNLADKPWAELVEASKGATLNDTLHLFLKAVPRLPPDRVAMALASVTAALVVGPNCDWNDRSMRTHEAAMATLRAFIEEARWMAL